MHILFFTDNFPPEVNAPASRTYEHCKNWVEQGNKVTVITGVPNFPKGKVYAGYKNRLFQKENMNGIEVIRVWTFIAPNEGTVRRTVDYLSFMITSIVASLFVRKPDIIVGTSPQFFTVCAAFSSAALRRLPWIFELRDLWPDSIRAVGSLKNSFFIRLMAKVEMFLYRKADAIVAVTNSFREELFKKGIDKRKIYVVTNGVDLQKFYKRKKDYELIRNLKLEKKFVLGYIGTHGLAHGLETLLYAAEKLQNKKSEINEQLILVGDGAEKAKLQKLSIELKLKNVIFVDTVPKDQIVRYWSILDYAIIHLKDQELFKTVIPSKVFESIGMGIPILHGVRGESADIVSEGNIGKLFNPEDVGSLVKVIEEAKSAPNVTKKLGLNAVSKSLKYDRKNLANEMLKIMKSTANENQ